MIYTYDFPGAPGSGLFANQTNHSQPANGTFSDFTRTGAITPLTSGGGTNVFGSVNWPTNAFIDTTQYEGFSITSDAGYHLDLTDITFLAKITPTGPSNGRVVLFVNGSSTATFNFSPTTSNVTYTFDFTDLTDADNATSVEFRFYGWNATGNGGALSLDNVATSGMITNAPEIDPCFPVLLLIAGVILSRKRTRSRPA